LLRRNIVVRGINLLALKGKVIHIGKIELEMTGCAIRAARWKRDWGQVATTRCAVMAE
jgi:MOSC domain-containing protein YiiM